MKFYVYQLRLECSELPFYIGKGKNSRKDVHLQEWSLKKRSHKNNVINKAMREGVKVVAEILHENLTEEQAFAKEIELIAFYGRRINGGCLTNATYGGEGPTGYKHTDEARVAMAESKRGRKLNRETREKISRAGKNRDPKSIARVASKNTGKTRSIETREKMAAAKRGTTHSREWKTAAKFRNWDKNPAWKDADDIYAHWTSSGKPGCVRLQKEYGYVITGIQRAFTEGWIPTNDPDWIAYARPQKEKPGS